MTKIGILGHFAFGKKLLNGQTIKTQNLDEGLKKYSDFELFEIDTCNWKKHPFRLLKNLKKAFKSCDAVIMLPAHHGVKIFAPLIAHYNKRFKKKIYYDVIGGWLPKLMGESKRLAKSLKRFDGIWVETIAVKKALEEKGFNNINIVPNFKDLVPVGKTELNSDYELPYKLCTFSRVSEKKGIDDAVDAVDFVNSELGYTAFTLDIYGQVEPDQAEWFEGLSKRLPSTVSYRGGVDSEKSVEVLKDYFALLFPTRFWTEGIPGTIIDAYSAGVPVVSAKWESFSDIVDDGVTGLGYEFGDKQDLISRLFEMVNNPKIITDKKLACLDKASEYMTENAIKIILQLIA